jgi:outer membrane protein
MGYFNFNAALERVDAQLASLEDAKATLKSVQIKFDTGLVDLQQLLQAKSDYESRRYDLEAAYAYTEKVRAELAAVIGVPVTDLVNIQPSEGFEYDCLQQEASIDDLIAVALKERPDLLSAYMQSESRKKHAQAAQKAMYPYLVAGAHASKNKGVENNFEPTEQAQVSIGVQWDIFDVFTNHYELLAARAEAKQAFFAFQAEQLKVMSEVWSSFYTYKAARNQLAAALAFLAVAEESYAAIRIGYNTGVNSLLDLLKAQDNLSLARFQKVDAKAASINSLSQLAYATGQLNHVEDIIKK